MGATFSRYIGIDYSGAETCESSLRRLRVYMTDQVSEPREVMPLPSPRRYWTRKEIAEWLVERLSEPSATLAGIDHGFSFPLKYFEKYELPHDWPAFLDDFQKHWPTDQKYTCVDFVRESALSQKVTPDSYYLNEQPCRGSPCRRPSEFRTMASRGK